MGRKQCRICLKYSDINLYLFVDNDETIANYVENIRHLADVELYCNDGLPQHICQECTTEIQSIIEFCLLIRRSDEQLRCELEQRAPKHEVDMEMLPNEESYMQMCVMKEEVLDGEIPAECLQMKIGEEYVKDDQNVDEIHYVVGEILEVHEADNSQRLELQCEQEKAATSTGDPLKEFAQVAAATQDELDQTEAFQYQDECDEDYLIAYNPADEGLFKFKPPKWKCVECKKVLRGDVSYDGHMNMHKNLRPHVCPECRCKFRCRIALKKHKELRHGRNKPTVPTKQDDPVPSVCYVCVECGEECPNEIDLLIHEVVRHDVSNNRKSCPLCPDLLVDNIADHLIYVHARKLKEILLENPNSVTSSHESPKLSSSADENEPDVEEVTEENSTTAAIVNCNVCNRKILKKNLKRHMSLHKDIKIDEEEEVSKFQCNFCPQTVFITREELNHHITSFHIYEPETMGSLPYEILHECVHCKEIFDDAATLTQHQKAKHNTKKGPIKSNKSSKYICKECGNKFGGHAQLSAHKRLHKERPFKCDECNKSYPRKVELEIHKRTHTGELPFACHLCDKRFAIKVRLTYHLQKHEGVSHTCDYCGATYDNRNKLKAHMFKHIGMPYKCELCPGVEFERRIRFANHMQRVHQRILSDDELAEIFTKNTGKTIRFKPCDSNKSNKLID
ncbi:uncharacterized protein LOC142234353 isoform X1 [Haematobia irritans]|uniref:uncharacterized protein LOC142234353 isoform X1 n=1 Tax=Haematobia irritans TaxID=7368 RepID=UPI003F509171